MSTTCGASGCWREKASSRAVRLAARGRRVGRRLDELPDVVLAARQLALDKVHGADDDGQHVVEIVRDAAGKLADRLHLLHLADLRFSLLARLDFPGERDVLARQFVLGTNDVVQATPGVSNRVYAKQKNRQKCGERTEA